MTTNDPTDVPPTLRAALESPRLERRGWQTALAPQFIGLFLWIAYFDQIPSETVGRGGLLWPVAGAVVGGLLCYAFLYRGPALWCWRSGRPAAVVAARTFGVDGATWVPGLLGNAAQVVWLAVSVWYATSLGLAGLELLGLVDPATRQPIRVGGFELPGALFLVTSLFWSVAASLTGRYLVRVIAALMSVYPILPALMLGVTAAVAMRGLPEYRGRMVGVGDGPGGTAANVLVALVAVQMVFGFFSAAALAFADHGRTALAARDVRLGGWVGVALASSVVATLAILSVAGAFPHYGLDAPVGPQAGRILTFTQSVRTLIGGRTAGMMLIGFSLVALAPACYAANLIGNRLDALFPSIPKTRWTLAGSFLAWGLGAAGLVSRLLPVFGVMGALFAPVAGAVSADYLRSQGAWPCARRGWNRPGWFAWVVGVVVGLTPVVADALGNRRFGVVRPAAVLAYVAAFVTYLALAALGSESPDDPAIGPEPGDVPG